MVWDIEFPFGWSVRYGFIAKTPEGIEYKLTSKGMFFWRKLVVSKNNSYLASFSLNKCLENDIPYWVDSRKFIYFREKKVCSLDPFKYLSEEETGAYLDKDDEGIYTWESESGNEWVIFTLVLLSIQGRGHVTGIRY